MSRIIYLTEDEKRRLCKLISDFLRGETGSRHLVLSLDKALTNVRIADKSHMPANTVLMHTSVLLGFVDAEEKVKLVFPEEADVEYNKISVLSPIGIAILGCKKGETVEWEGEDTVHSVLIKDILIKDDF